MSTDVAVYQGNQFSREQLDVMRQTVAAGTSNAEFALFLEVCKHRKLNPFNREIYVIPGKNGKMTFQVSIDGLRLLAERSGKYQGQIGPLWCGKDGEWKEVWLEDAPPAAAKVGVIRSDFKEPIWSVAKFKSYVGASPIWQKMPDLMLAKCAESLALRRAFPDQMAGLYTREEMMQADSEHDLPAQVLAQETAQETVTIEAEVIAPAQPIDRDEALRELARPGPARAGKALVQAQPASVKAKLYDLGKSKGMWDKPEGFYAASSAVLGKPVNAASWSELSAQDILQIEQMVRDEQSRKTA